MPGPLRKADDRFSQTEIDGEVVVMDLDNGNFFSLTGTAAAIWQLIDGTRDRAALLAELAEHYGRTVDELAEETDAFLAQLSNAGLIESIK